MHCSCHVNKAWPTRRHWHWESSHVWHLCVCIHKKERTHLIIVKVLVFEEHLLAYSCWKWGRPWRHHGIIGGSSRLSWRGKWGHSWSLLPVEPSHWLHGHSWATRRKIGGLQTIRKQRYIVKLHLMLPITTLVLFSINQDCISSNQWPLWNTCQRSVGWT